MVCGGLQSTLCFLHCGRGEGRGIRADAGGERLRRVTSLQPSVSCAPRPTCAVPEGKPRQHCCHYTRGGNPQAWHGLNRKYKQEVQNTRA